MRQEMKLSEARTGGKYRVLRVGGSGLVKQRIAEMGIVPGVVVKVLRAAPLKDPIEIEVREDNISIRRGEASYVEVEEVD